MFKYLQYIASSWKIDCSLSPLTLPCEKCFLLSIISTPLPITVHYFISLIHLNTMLLFIFFEKRLRKF